MAYAAYFGTHVKALGRRQVQGVIEEDVNGDADEANIAEGEVIAHRRILVYRI